MNLIDAETGKVSVINRFQFTRLHDLEARWKLESEGKILGEGNIDIDAAPLDTVIVTVPYKKPEPEPGKEYFLTLSFHLKQNRPWAKAGFEIAFEQFRMPWEIKAVSNTVKNLPNLTLEETRDSLIIRGARFDYLFDKTTGKLITMYFMGKLLVTSGPALNVWRAPLANETDEWGSRSSGATHWGEGYSRMAATDWYSTGIDRLSAHIESFKYITDSTNMIIEVHEVVTVSNLSSGFLNVYRYTIDGSGAINLRHKIVPWGDMPAWLPRIGTTWILSPDLNIIQWYGRGPQENYPDRKTGYRIGKYSSLVSDMFEPYIIPQDNGLRTDNRWVTLNTRQGIGLKFSGDEPFNFNAWPYTVENLTKALYTFQLKPFGGITFNFDHMTSGVGCTARSVFNPYRVLPQTYEYTMYVTPFFD
jgi:beta-galactosidase